MIVRDTHAWIWWLSAPERLSSAARTAISQTPSVGISTISVWELGTLLRRGRLEFIYATARALGAPLVTRDAAIRRFDAAGTIW